MGNRFIEVQAVNHADETAWFQQLQRAATPAAHRSVDIDEDDLERAAVPPMREDDEDTVNVTPGTTMDISNPPVGVYSPMIVFENDVRCVNARRGNRAFTNGARITFRSGQSVRTRESYEEIKAKFAALHVSAPSVPQVPAPSRSRSRSRVVGGAEAAEAATEEA